MALFLTEEDVAGLLTMDVALEAVEEGFRRQADGTASNSPRSRTPPKPPNQEISSEWIARTSSTER